MSEYIEQLVEDLPIKGDNTHACIMFTIDLKDIKYNDKYNKYDNINQYPVLYIESAHIESAHIESAHIESAHIESATIESATIESATIESAPIESATIESAPKKIPSKITAITPIEDKSYSKKKRQTINKQNNKCDVDYNLLKFKYANPYGFIHMYNPKYSNSTLKETFIDIDTENIREKMSTKFIINDRKSKYSGYVFDITTKKPISIPPQPLLKKLNKKGIELVNTYLEQKLYDIIKIEDGTIITLYSWIHPTNGLMWSMASNNGYDVSSFKWMGKMTYAEIFYDLVNRLYPEFKEITGLNILYIPHGGVIKTILTFTNLDTNYCYTMGFRHHNFHPMKIDPEKIWQVQYSDLSSENPKVYYGGKFLPTILPIQEVWDYSKFVNVENTVNYTIIKNKGKSSFINTCIEIGKSVEDSIYFEKDDVLQSNFSPQYGFIFRSLDFDKTGDLSNFIIEYPLFQVNKELIYDQYSSLKDCTINEKNRMYYNAMRAFLNDGRGDIYTSAKKKFTSLYPEWSPKFYGFNEFMNSLTIQIINNIIGISDQEFKSLSDSHSSVKKLNFNKIDFDKVALDFSKIIKIFYGIKKLKNMKNIEKNVHDFITNSEYASVYLRVLNI
jgi:broad specificity phosphatase PhoE